MDDELELLNRARAASQEALAEIHDRYYQPLYRYISFRVADPQTAEDLASEVFIRFLAAIRGQGSPPNTLRGWLFGAARNVLREQYRAQRKEKAVELDEAMAGSASTESSVEKRLDSAELRQALDDLTQEQQHVLALRFGYGMPVRDVAEAVNKSEGSVKMLQARAIAALTRKLTGQGMAGGTAGE